MVMVAALQNDSNLPHEILEKILKNFSYRLLSQFKCVSKFWNFLLTSPSFIPPHLSDFIKHHSYDQSIILKLTLPRPEPKDIRTITYETHKIFSLSSKDPSALVVNTSFPADSSMFGSMKFKISGHCNGILCLSIYYRPYKKTVVLFNPATKQFKILPDSVMLEDESSFPVAVGMGYDSKSDDYKVVRMISKGDEYCTQYGMEEYSLNTDSWRPLPVLGKENFGSRGFPIEDYSFALFFKGTYYWWATQNSLTKILGLNMGDDEEIRLVLEPKQPCRPYYKQLAVWKESICLIYLYRDEDDLRLRKIDLWLMNIINEFDGQVSWTKMRSLTNIPFARVHPLVFWKGNELLLQANCGHREWPQQSYST